MKTVRHPTRRYYTDGHAGHGAALASQTAAQVDALTRLICAARASTQPAVTVAMEGLQ